MEGSKSSVWVFCVDTVRLVKFCHSCLLYYYFAMTRDGFGECRYNHINEGDEHGTTHISIVDKYRNAVAMTCTINDYFGAKFISEQTGILMNNEMDDFGTPLDNITNGLPAKPNFIKPNKRPLSTMSPTIVLEVTSQQLIFLYTIV